MEELIQPVKVHEELIEEIDKTVLSSTQVAIWWLGQSGFILKSQESVLCIDPYLSEYLTVKYENTEKPHIRMTKSPLNGYEIKNINILMSTHKHSDHMDPITIKEVMEASKQCKYIIPRVHRDYILSYGIDQNRVIPADVDKKIDINGVEIIPQPAAHEKIEYINNIGYYCMGFIIKMGSMVLYHSGDTIPYKGMIERLKENLVDVAFLPINGRDKIRRRLGTPGNCTIEEALCIAELAGIKVLVPHHYNMFTFNTVDIKKFEEWSEIAFPTKKTCIMECGEKYIFDKNDF